MVDQSKKQNILWMAPSPLWGEQSAWMRLPMQNQPKIPVILRFANDMFMDEMMAMLTHSPWRFDEWVAQYETWREPMPTPRPIEISRPTVNLPESYNKPNRLVQNYPRATRLAQIKSRVTTPATLPPSASEKTLRLYHASHQRYYMVTASLVAEEKGYPDYPLNLGAEERASFVVRALVDNEDQSCDEYAFVTTSSGKAWRKVGRHEIESAAVQRVMPNEERLPLFPVAYPDGCGRLRRLYGALIPVGRRDEWIDAPAFQSGAVPDGEIASPVPAADGGVDHYKEILYSDVIAPWKALIDRCQMDKRKNNVQDGSFPNFTFDAEKVKLDKMRSLRAARDEIQTSSWYVLHDFARFLREHLPRVWKKLHAFVTGKDDGAVSLSGHEAEVFNLLKNTKMDSRLFLELALENLAVGGFFADAGVSVWNRLIDLWKLEIFLQLSAALYVSDGFASELREKVNAMFVASQSKWSPFASSEMTPEVAQAREDYYFAESCLQFLAGFQSQSSRTVLDFAEKLALRYPELKIAALKKTTPFDGSDGRRLFPLLQKIYIPVVQRNLLSALGGEISAVTDIKKTLWEILSLYWTFEDYVADHVDEGVCDTVLRVLHGKNQLDVSDMTDQIMAWFYQDVKAQGKWYSFLRFAADLKSICPRLYTTALFEIFGKQLNPDKQTLDLIDILKTNRMNTAVHAVLAYPNPDARTIRIIPTLAEAIVSASSWTDALEDVDTPYDRSLMADSAVLGKKTWWPDFLFPLTDPEPDLTLEEGNVVPALSEGAAPETDAENLKLRLDEFAVWINDLVPKASLGDARSSFLSLEPLLTEKDPRFVVRFVFERPRCGIIFPAVVSQATCPFELALFMDPDAPARTVRVHMPLDISPAGLRKYKKNAMFVFSDMMCGKMKKVRKLTLADLVLSVLPWPFHKDLPDVGSSAGPCDSGVICSLSIPIVTLCAMILVFIMVSLFEMVFKWMPWFFVCFPVPGMPNLKAKKVKVSTSSGEE